MSNTSRIAKIFILLGILYLLISTTYPGSMTAWTTLQTTLSNGIPLPSLYNPFHGSFFAGTMLPISNNNHTTRTVHGCPTNAYWECLPSNDGNGSYVRILGPSSYFFTVNMSNVASPGTEVPNLYVNIACWSNGTNRFRVVFGNASSGLIFPQNDQYDFSCPIGTSAQNLTVNAIPICTSIPANSYCTWSATNLTNIAVTIETWPTASQSYGNFSFVSMDVYTTNQPPCSGSFFENTGCQIGRFFQTIINGVVFFFSALLFVIQSALAVILFFFQVIAGIFIGVFGVFVFFLAFPCPVGTVCMPAAIQAILAAIVVGCMVYVFVSIAVLIRGSDG